MLKKITNLRNYTLIAINNYRTRILNDQLDFLKRYTYRLYVLKIKFHKMVYALLEAGTIQFVNTNTYLNEGIGTSDDEIWNNMIQTSQLAKPKRNSRFLLSKCLIK